MYVRTMESVELSLAGAGGAMPAVAETESEPAPRPEVAVAPAPPQPTRPPSAEAEPEAEEPASCRICFSAAEAGNALIAPCSCSGVHVALDVKVVLTPPGKTH